MRVAAIWLSFLFLTSLHAQKSTISQDDCNKIFEQRKQELILKLDQLEEKQSALESLQSAGKAQQTQREERLKQKIVEITALLDEVKKREANTKTLLEENKKILEAITKAKDDKITQMYAKMKPASAAGILSEMNATASAGILFTLEPKKVAEFLSKMDAKKASEVSQRLRQGPPFN